MLTPPEPTLAPARSSENKPVPEIPPAPSSLGQNYDELTVVVFKDNFAARTFRVPLRWISRLGMLVAILALAAALSSLLAAKYYRIARRGNPLRVNELEDELNSLRTSYSSLQAKAIEDAKKLSVATVPQPPAPIAQQPAPPPPPPPAAAAPILVAARPAGMTALLFQDLPGNVTALPSSTADVSVKLAPPKLKWRGTSLLVQTALEYSRNDGGNQQGHIVVLARGPATIFAYPETALNTGAAPNLISPEHGESYSVSRYREINAEFGPARNAAALQDLEILIFSDPEGTAPDAPVSLLIHEHIPIPAPAQPAPKPARRQQSHAAPAPKHELQQTPSADGSSAAPGGATTEAPSAPGGGNAPQAPTSGSEASPPGEAAPKQETPPASTSAPVTPPGGTEQ